MGTEKTGRKLIKILFVFRKKRLDDFHFFSYVFTRFLSWMILFAVETGHKFSTPVCTLRLPAHSPAHPSQSYIRICEHFHPPPDLELPRCPNRSSPPTTGISPQPSVPGSNTWSHFLWLSIQPLPGPVPHSQEVQRSQHWSTLKASTRCRKGIPIFSFLQLWPHLSQQLQDCSFDLHLLMTKPV